MLAAHVTLYGKAEYTATQETLEWATADAVDALDLASSLNLVAGYEDIGPLPSTEALKDMVQRAKDFFGDDCEFRYSGEPEEESVPDGAIA